MENELEKLRISKHHKASRQEKSAWPWVIVLILLVGSGVVLWRLQSATAAPVVQTVRVRVPEGTSATNDLVALNATGYIIAAHKIELACKVIGRVAWVGVEMGDKVTKGQILVRLEDDEYKARVAQRQAELDNARARFAQTDSDWSRAQKLGSSEALAQQRYDQYKADHQMALANVALCQATLDLAALDLENTTIRAPIDSTILARNVEVGEFVTTGFVGDRGAKGYVVSIADLNDLRVELDISQNDFAKVLPQQPCWIVTDAYPDKKYEGVVDLISPEANRQKATVQVRVKVKNPDGLLKPDMNATVSFLAPLKPAATTESSMSSSAPVEQQQPAVRVPSAAVRDGSVFVVESGKAIKRVVSTGQTSASGEIEIHKGLIGGEDLIVNPPSQLKDGDPVRVQSETKNS